MPYTGDKAISVFKEAFGEGFLPGGLGKIVKLVRRSRPLHSSS